MGYISSFLYAYLTIQVWACCWLFIQQVFYISVYVPLTLIPAVVHMFIHKKERKLEKQKVSRRKQRCLHSFTMYVCNIFCIAINQFTYVVTARR